MENQPIQEKQSNKAMIIVIVVIILLGATLGIYLFTKKDDSETTTNTTTNAATVTNTNTDPYADLMLYDNKLVTISSADDKVTGQMAISIDKTQKMPITVVFFFKVDDTLAKSVAANLGAGESYYYIANHTSTGAVNDGNGTGSLSQAFCNTDAMPDVLALAQQRSIDLELYRGCDAQNDPFHTAETFYHIYSNYYNSSTFDYDKLIGRNTLAIFDTAPYYEKNMETGGFGVQDSTVIAQSVPTIIYDLLYTE